MPLNIAQTCDQNVAKVPVGVQENQKNAKDFSQKQLRGLRRRNDETVR